jgi:hypothetical protein
MNALALKEADVPEGGSALMSLGQARASATAGRDATLAWLVEWTANYLTRNIEKLGRRRPVCPFTPQAIRLDTIRLGVSETEPGQRDAVLDLVRDAFDELDAIPCAPGMEQFRAVVLAFPRCRSPEGVEMLKGIQSRLAGLSLRRSRMIGLFYPNHPSKGAWNADFRPLDAPVPMMVVRQLVEHDAPFALRNPRLLALYLYRFRGAGLRRLHAYMTGKA